MAFNLPLTNPLAVTIPAQAKGIEDLLLAKQQNKYYGPSQEANIASKSTYAQYLPSQILGQVLANPLVWQTMDPQQLKSLTNQYANSLRNPPSLRQMIPSLNSGSSDGLLGLLLDKLSGRQSEQQPGYGNNIFGQEEEFPIQNALKATPIEQGIGNNQNAVALPSNVNLPNTLVNRTAPGYRIGSGGINPLTTAKAQAAGLETSATSEAGNQASQWKDLTSHASENSEQAVQNEAIIDKLEESYSHLKSYEKGPVLGKLPAFSEAASDVDKGQAALADAVARAQQSGHITQADRATYGSMKPTRDQPGKAFEHQLLFNRGMNRRIQEKPAFLQAAANAGLNPTEASAVWTYYIHSRPFYNPKENKINDKNLNSWEDFLTPQKVREAFSPSARKKELKSDVVNVMTPDGKIWPVRAEKVDVALKRHPGSKVVK